MRRRRIARVFAAVAAAAAAAAFAFSASGEAPAPALAARLGTYFAGWYASVPATHVVATPTREISVPGFSAWRIVRRPDTEGSKPEQEESSLALYDAAKDEVFLGEILHDPDRLTAKKPFDRAADLPNLRASLREVFGLPVDLEVAESPDARGLIALKLLIRQDKDAFAARPGFLSKDGASLLIGEFRPMSQPLRAWREKLLAERPGVRVESGRFVVTEFLDFECERCKRRTPEGRQAVLERGGALEVRFFPLVKQHDWAFAASECGAALAGAGLPLYARFEEAVFARQEGMSAAAARELAADIADAAGARAAFDAEIASGRARERVLKDIDLALRIGAHGTPIFVLDGRLVPGPRGFLENALFLSHGKPGPPPPTVRPGTGRP